MLFGLLNGVRQRGISSAISFCVILLAISIFLCDDIEYGFKSIALSYVTFADDLVLITYTGSVRDCSLFKVLTSLHSKGKIHYHSLFLF